MIESPGQSDEHDNVWLKSDLDDADDDADDDESNDDDTCKFVGEKFMFVLLPLNIVFLSVDSSDCDFIVCCWCCCDIAHLIPLLATAAVDIEVIGKVLCTIELFDFEFIAVDVGAAQVALLCCIVL